MRILYIANSHIWGGGEQAVLLAAQLMSERGHRVGLVAGRGSPLAQRVRESAGAIVPGEATLGPKLGHRTIADFLCHARRYRSELCRVVRMTDSGSWDLIHLQYKKEQLLATRALAQHGYAVAWTEHGGLPAALVKNPMARLWYRRAARVASGIAPVSHYVAESLARAGVRHEVVRVVYNAADERMFRLSPHDRARSRLEVRGSLGWLAESKVVGTVCRMAPRKGLARLMSAALHLMYSWEELCLLIVGDGPERAKLEAMVPGELVPRVRFTGFRRDVARYLAAMDVFVSASEDPTEGFPLRVVEAMMVGVPVVATRVAGQPEAVRDGETGLLVGPRDERGLAEAIEGLVADPMARCAMGMKARREAMERFGTRRFGEAHEAFLKECLEWYARTAGR